MLTYLSQYISKNRSAIMGFAIVWIFLLHSAIGYEFSGITKYTLKHGWAGVDIFIFLSSFGLCYSLQKNPLKKFYKNRVLRILPCWFIVLVLVHIAGVVISPHFPGLNFNYPHTFKDTFYWYSGLGYYFNGCHYEWYVPSILLFYALIPLVIKLDTKIIWILLVICTLMAGILTYFKIAHHIHFSYQRVMCFMLGVLFYRHNLTNDLKRFYIASGIGTIVMIPVCMSFHLPDVFVYEFATPFIVLLLAQILRLQYVNYIFSFLGAISLELYLVHLYRRPQFLISFISDNLYIQVLGAFVLSMIAAVILQKVSNTIIKKINYENTLISK